MQLDPAGQLLSNVQMFVALHDRPDAPVRQKGVSGGQSVLKAQTAVLEHTFLIQYLPSVVVAQSALRKHVFLAHLPFMQLGVKLTSVQLASAVQVLALLHA